MFDIRSFQGDCWGIVRDTVAASVRCKLTAFCSINHPCTPFSLSFYDAVSYDAGIRYYTKGEPLPEGVEKGVNLMFYDFTHRLTGKAQEAAMAQLFLEDEFQEQYDPKLMPSSTRRENFATVRPLRLRSGTN